MPRVKPLAMASPDSGDEDRDDISITSTAPSAAQDEYLVEEILAERTDTGVTEYLVKWDGYPEERCTWEPRSSFQAEEEPEGPALLEWRTRKMRLDRGLQKPYNVEALETKVEAIEDAKRKRKDRRWAKRKRLGIPVPSVKPSKQLTTSSSDIEAVEDDNTGRFRGKTESSSSSESDNAVQRKRRTEWTDQEDNALMKGLSRIGSSWDQIREMYPILKLKSHLDLEREARHLRSTFIESGRDVPQCLQVFDKKKPKSKRTRKDEGDESSEDSLLENIRTQAPNKTFKKLQKRGKLKTSEEPTEDIYDFEETNPTERQQQTQSPTLKPTVANPSQPMLQRRTQVGRVGTGPAGRGGHTINPTGITSRRPPIQGAAIFGNWNQASTRKPYGTGKTGDQHKLFDKLSIQNRTMKAHRREPAPNPAHLSFIDRQTGCAIDNPISAVHSQPPKKTPFQLLQEQRRNAVETEEAAVDIDASTPADDLDEDTLMMIDSITKKDEVANVKTRENSLITIASGPPTQSRVVTGPGPENSPVATPLTGSTSVSVPTGGTVTSSRSVSLSTTAKPILPTNQALISTLNTTFMSRQQQIAEPVLTGPVPAAKDSEPWQATSDLIAPQTTTPFPKDILGLLEIGSEHDVVGEVRFRGIPEIPYTPQFRTVVHPRNMLYAVPRSQSTGRTHYWFERICIADEYRKYFPWVNDRFPLSPFRMIKLKRI